MNPLMAESRSHPLVLVADDDNNLRKILCLFLRNARYETVEAANGREALQMAKSQDPDLILMDIMMPMLDGFTVCKMLKDDPDTKRIPVLICTAKNRKEDLVAVQISTGMRFVSGSSLSILQTVKPSSMGIMMSMRIRSGSWLFAIWSASRPLAASTVS